MVLRKLKRLLGLGSDDSGGRSERDVTVQGREDTDAENEAAVKGTDDPSDDTGDDEPTDGDDDPVAAGTDADASTESLVDEEAAEEESAGRAEPAEAAGPESDDETTDVEGVDVDAEAAAEAADEGDGDSDDEPVAAGTDADASTESLVDEEIAQEEPSGRAEPAEAAGPDAEDETTDIEEIGADVEADAEAAADSPPVDEIKGIGPAYSERLAEIDIATVADLREADPEAVAERTTVPEKTVRKWIDRASDHE